MKFSLIAAASMLLLVSSAHAAPANDCPGNSCHGGGDASATGGSATAIAGDSSAYGGSAQQGQYQGIFGSGNSRIDTRVGLTSDQRQGQSQGQSQSSASDQAQSLVDVSSHSASAVTGPSSSSASATAAGQQAHQSVSFIESAPRQTASAISPPMVNVSPCALGASAAGQGPGFGFSLGAGRIDKACAARQMAQVLFQLGEREAAVLYLSGFDPTVGLAVTSAHSQGVGLK